MLADAGCHITSKRDLRPCALSARRGINGNEDTVVVSPQRPHPVCGLESSLKSSCRWLVVNGLMLSVEEKKAGSPLPKWRSFWPLSPCECI